MMQSVNSSLAAGWGVGIGSNTGTEQTDQFDHVLFGHSVIAVQKDVQKILGGAEKTAERLTAPGQQLACAVVDGDGVDV